MKKAKTENEMDLEKENSCDQQQPEQSGEQVDVETLKAGAQAAAQQMMEALRQCEVLNQALQEATQKTEQYHNQLLHLKAEFDNYRKRTSAEIATARETGATETLKALLPTLDNIDRALAIAKEESSQAVADGLEMVFANLLLTFEKKGLQIMDVLGKPFDPKVHEAVMQEQTEDEEQKNTVAQVLQKGYLYNGQVLRYATVKVYV